MQPTTPTITVNSVTSTWASTPDTRWAQTQNLDLLFGQSVNISPKSTCTSCPVSDADVRVNAARLHVHAPVARRGDPALLHHPQVQGALVHLQPLVGSAGEHAAAAHLGVGKC